MLHSTALSMALQVTFLSSLALPEKPKDSARNQLPDSALLVTRLRSKVYSASAQVMVAPLWNFTPLRRSKVTVLPPLVIFQPVARRGSSWVRLAPL